MADVNINLIVSAKGIKQFGDVGRQLSDLGKKADQIGKSFARVGSQLTGVGTALTSVALPLVALGGFAVKTALDFERSFLEIENLVGIAADEVAVMKEAVLDLAGETATRPRELADALFAVTSAGARGSEALNILERAAKASAIGLGDVRAVALAVTAATTAYGAETLSAAQATDILVSTVKFGNLEASQLAGTLGRVTPIASQVGASFADVGAFIATFTRLGGDAAEATTALRGVLNALIKPGTDAKKALAELGLSAEGLRRQIREEGLAQALITLQEATAGNAEVLGRIIPNVRAFTGVLATAGAQSESFLRDQEAIRSELGIVSESFDNFSKSAVFSFDQFAAKAEVAAIRLGDALAPALADLLDAAEPVFKFITDLAKKFTELDPATQKTAVAFAIAAAAAGPLLIIFGQLATGVGQLLQLSSPLIGSLGKLATGLSTTGGAATLSAGAITGLSVAAGVATAAIAVKGTQALVGYGDALRGIDDPIRDAVAQQGFLAQTMAVLPDIIGLVGTAFTGFISIISNIPIIGDLIKVSFQLVAVVFQELAKGLSIISDAATSFFEKFVTAEGAAESAQQSFIVSNQQLAAASELAGRAITDQDEASQILQANIFRLRDAHDENTRSNLESAEAAMAAAGATDQDAAAKLASAAAAAAATAANEEYLKSVQALAGTLGFAALTQQIKLSEDAIKSLGGASKLSASGLQSLSGVIDQAREDGVKLTGELLKAAKALNVLNLVAGRADLLAGLEAPAIAAEDLAKAIEEDTAAFFELEGTAVPGLSEIEAGIGGLPPKAFDFQGAMAGVNDLLSEARGLMTLFGISSDSAFGKVISGATKVFDIFNAVTGTIDKVGGALSKLGGLFGGEGVDGGGIIGRIAGLFGGGGDGAGTGGIVKGLVTKLAPVAAKVGGALSGVASGIGGAISGVLGGIGPAVLAAGPFAPLAVGVIFGIRAALKKASAETTAEALGIDFSGLSETLQKKLQEEGKKIGDFAAALQLNLGAIISEGVITDLDEVAERIADTFAFLERGEITQIQAQDILGDTVPQLLAQLDQLGTEGTAQVERLLRASQDFGVAFAGQDEVVARLGQSLVQAAETGGQAFLNATNEIGTTGRESLEFLANEFGTVLPESVLASINSILGLNSAVAETAGGANQIGVEFSALPTIASEAVTGIGTAFAEGSSQIVEGLQPVSDKISTEIREAGTATSAAVTESFGKTNAAIEAGLGKVAATFAGPVTSSANRAAAAADRIADAARRAAKAASEIEFPSGGGGGGGMSAQAGFRGRLSRDTLIQAHQGEFVNIVPRSEASRMNFVSAQGGLGPGAVSVRTGGNRIELNVTGGGDQIDEVFFRDRVLPMLEDALRRNENEIVQRIREQIFEEVR